MKVQAKYVTRAELQNCPAEIDMISGVVSINKDVWDNYDDFEKKFIILHELGHYNLQTDDESQADRYALERVYRTASKSLKRSLQTLYKVGILDSARMWQLYIEALQLDAKDGNEDAAIELYNINNNILNLETMGPRGNQNFIRKNKFDGDTTTTETVETRTEEKRGHKKNGFSVRGVYFSITNILLIVNCILLIMIVGKFYRN